MQTDVTGDVPYFTKDTISLSPQRDPGCSRCSSPRDRLGQRLCRPCHAAYMRSWRAQRHHYTRTLESLLLEALLRCPPL